jgi:hypothetical protein
MTDLCLYSVEKPQTSTCQAVVCLNQAFYLASLLRQLLAESYGLRTRSSGENRVVGDVSVL